MQFPCIGHLFQGRFKSVLVDEEQYLRELIRYIHLNPVRAKLESLPQQYRWSSHNAYMGSDEFYWLTKDRVLMKFDSEQKTAIQNLEKYILQGIGIETEFDFKTGCAKGILGDEDFMCVLKNSWRGWGHGGTITLAYAFSEIYGLFSKPRS